MRRALLAACALPLFATACSSPPPPPVPSAVDLAEEAAQEDALTMQGIKLYLYGEAAMPGQERLPEFSVEADQFVQEAEKQWKFSQARATVHPRSPEDPAIVFEAETGRLTEEDSARLEGGVRTTVGDLAVTMESVDWLQGVAGSGGMAFSDQPVAMTGNTLNLFAEQFRMYPDDGNFRLFDVHGEVKFGPAAAVATPAGEAAAPAEGEDSP